MICGNFKFYSIYLNFGLKLQSIYKLQFNYPKLGGQNINENSLEDLNYFVRYFCLLFGLMKMEGKGKKVFFIIFFCLDKNQKRNKRRNEDKWREI